MSDSVRSDPRRLRATRRARPPAVRARAPSPGYHHPASAQDVRTALHAFGEDAYYGLRLIELRPPRTGHGRMVLGRLSGEGTIELYEQRGSPWRLEGDALSPAESARLAAAGADVSTPGLVAWPAGALRAFMLRYVLAHELGHHVLQHERRLKGEPAARTRDHEARAEQFAAELRARCPSI